MPICDEEDFAFIEYISPEAFDDTINSNDEIMLLYSHDWSLPLARRSAGRLDVSKQADGIYFSAKLPDTTRSQDLIKDIECGNVKGNSFGFIVEKDEWSRDENGNNIRKIVKGKLFEISAVVNPAYPDTTLAKRNFTAFAGIQKKNNLEFCKARLRYLQLKSKSKIKK